MDSQMNVCEVEKLERPENYVDDKTSHQHDSEEHTPQEIADGVRQKMDSSNNEILHDIFHASDDELYAFLPQDFTLSDKDLEAIKYITSAPENQKMVHIDDNFIYRRYMQCLLKDNFLLGEVMSAYICCIRSQKSVQNRDGGSVFLEDTYVSGVLKIQGNIDADENVSDWLIDRAQIYLQHDMVFLPINIEDSHWYLAVIDAPKQQIQILDSLCWSHNRSDLKNTLAGLESIFKVLARTKHAISHKWKDQKVSSWERVEHLQSALQSDSVSCGLYTLKFMEMWTGTKLSQSFNQVEIKKFRLKLAAVLFLRKTNKARTTLEFENIKDTGTEGVECLGTRPSKRKNTGDLPSEANRYAALLHVLSIAGIQELLGCLCSYIMSIDDEAKLEKEWVRSSMPYPIYLTLRHIKTLLDEDLGMDTDCFNMGVRMLVSGEVQRLRKSGENIYKHYMDMKFCTMSRFTQDEKYRPKVDSKELAKCFGGWPGLPYDTSARNMMLMMPIAVGGRYTLYVFDETARFVYVMDPKPYSKVYDQESEMKIHLLKLIKMQTNIEKARRVGCPNWSEQIIVLWKQRPAQNVPKASWQLSGFYALLFMRAWNGIMLQTPLHAAGANLRTEFLLQLLTFQGNEIEVDLPPGIDDLVRCIVECKVRKK